MRGPERLPVPVGLPGAAVVVLRHGRTAWSGQGRFAGHADVPLDATGRAQARAAAARLVPLRPSALVSSDLARARHTAEAVAAATGLAVTVDARLREEHLGGWEGLTRAEAEARYPDEFARWRGGHVGRSAQREGLSTVAARATAALGDALARAVGPGRAGGRGTPPEPPVLVVVTHVNTAVALGGRLLGEPDGGVAARAACDLAPGAFAVLACDDAGRWRLRPGRPDAPGDPGPGPGGGRAARRAARAAR